MKKTRLVVFAVLLLAACLALWWRVDWLEHSQDGPIRAAARRYGLEPALVKAVVWRESRFQPDARGRAQEIGLMQLQEEAAREWAAAEGLADFDHEHCLSPVTNTLAGTWYLRKLLRRYQKTDHPLLYALADYNAGRGNVLKWAGGAAATNSAEFLQRITFPGTRAYIAAITNRYARYRDRFK